MHNAIKLATILSGGQTYAQYLQSLLAGHDGARWPLTDTSGTQATDYSGNGLHGTYNNVTLADVATPLGSAPTFNGSTSYVQLPQAGLETTFDPTDANFKLTLILAVNMSAANWGNASPYSGIRLGVDSSNFFSIDKTSADALHMRGRVGGGASISSAYSVVSADHDKYLLFAVAISRADNRMTWYAKTDSGTAAYPSGTWTASDLTAGFCQIGAVSNTAQNLPGSLFQAAAYTDEMTAAQYATLYSRFKAVMGDLAA